MPDPTSRPHPVPIRPGLTGGACPERPPDPEDWLHTSLHALAGLARAVVPGRAGRCPLGAIHQLGQGLAPSDPSEWMPLYEVYYRAGNLDRANELGALLRSAPEFIGPYCAQFAVQEQAQVGQDAFLVENLCPQIQGQE